MAKTVSKLSLIIKSKKVIVVHIYIIIVVVSIYFQNVSASSWLLLFIAIKKRTMVSGMHSEI